MNCGSVSKDHYVSIWNRFGFVPPFPNCKFSKGAVLTAVVVGGHIVLYKNTKLEEGMKDVAELMCRSEGIRLHSFPIARDPEKMCQEVRKGFQRIRIYIKSEWTEDVKEAKRLFDRIR